MSVTDGLSELTPLSVTLWFCSLLEKCREAIAQLGNGSLACTVPVRAQRGESSDEPLASQMVSVTVVTNAADVNICVQARAMYGLRHPIRRAIELHTDSDREPRRHDGSASPITPSVPGLAFAVVAAALPLLRANQKETIFGECLACSGVPSE